MKSRILFIFIILTSVFLNCYAQNNSGKISGLIRDVQNKPLAGATVVLRNLVDTLNQQTRATDNSGSFTFNNLKKGAYSLHVSSVGYDNYYIAHLSIDDNHPAIDLPIIILKPSGQLQLKAVVVTAKKPLIEQKIDRTIVNVDAMLSAAGGNALDVLSKSPGVIIDANDGISLNGENNVLVLIDDRPTYMSAQDLAAYLRSLPGGVLDKLELMSNPPARYDASGGAIINIVLKKNRTAGFNGGINLGYNQGVYGRSNDALNVNYRNKSFNIFSNIGYGHDENFSNETFSRYFFNGDGSPKSALLQNSRYVYQSDAWNGRIGMDYFANAKTTLGFMLTGNTRPKTDRLDYTNAQYNNTMQVDSTGRGYTGGQYTSQNAGLNLNMQHKFDSTGTALTADLDYLHFNSNATQVSPLAVYLPDGGLISNQQRVFALPAGVNIYSGKVDFSHPFAGKAEFDAGIKSSYVVNDNQYEWFNQNGDNLLPDYSQTNHFRYAENINSAYINFKKEWKRWAVQGGLRFENTVSKGHQFGNPAIADSAFSRHYSSLFPSLYVSYRLDSSGNHTLRGSYSERIHRPGYQQLNPFLFYHDQYSYTTGNTTLVPDFTHYLSLTYSYKGYFGISFNYGFGNNTISSLTHAVGNVFISSPQNFINNQTFGVIPYFSLSPAPWWTLHLNAVLLLITNNGNKDGVSLNQHTNVHEIETTNEFRLGKTWSAELDGFFPGKQAFGQNSGSAIYNISGGLQKSIMQGLGTVRLNVNDILHTMNGSSQTTAINQVSAFSTKETDTRRIGLAFTFRFGKAANERKRNHNTGSAEDEKGRTN